MFAFGLMRHSDEHAMEACQIGSRSRHQGCRTYSAADLSAESLARGPQSGGLFALGVGARGIPVAAFAG